MILIKPKDYDQLVNLAAEIRAELEKTLGKPVIKDLVRDSIRFYSVARNAPPQATSISLSKDDDQSKDAAIRLIIQFKKIKQ